MITVLCGRVAAGKSTLAAQLEAEGAVQLSCDEVMLGLFDGCLGAAHDATAMKCLRYLFSLAAQLARKGLDVVIDYGFWLRAERDAARDFFTRAKLPFRLLLVDAPEQTRHVRLARRNEGLRQADGRVYLIEGELLTRMEQKFQPPAPEEVLERFDNEKELP